MLYLFLAILLAYLIGAIPTSVWIGRTFYNVDVRTQGSGNAGATNTLRVLGPKAGIPVLLLDVFKGWLAVYISRFFYGPTFPMADHDLFEIILAFSAIMGHVFPIYVGFKGGKGISTILGMGLALYPLAALIAIGVFIIVLLISGYVSMGSIIASVTFPVFEILVLGHDQSIPLMILAILVAVFIPITHWKNIQRLLKGEESKFKVKKKA